MQKALQNLRDDLNPKCTFKEFWDTYIVEHSISLSQSKIFELAGLSKTTGNDVLNGKNNPKRDTCLALCFAIGMDVENTNRALKYAGHAPLYEQIDRDIALIIYFRQHAAGTGKIKNVTELNLDLDSNDIEPLKVSK